MKKKYEKRGPFLLVGSREAYKNPWIRVREDTVIRPDGTRGIFGVIEMKSGSSVLAITDDNQVYLVKEYKYGIERYSTELMSGALEDKETPLAAAKRELKEEIGLKASKWISLGMINPFTTAVHSPNYLFVALGVQAGNPSPDGSEVLQITKVPFQKAVDMVLSGKITHAASCVLILKTWHYMKEYKKSIE